MLRAWGLRAGRVSVGLPRVAAPLLARRAPPAPPAARPPLLAPLPPSAGLATLLAPRAQPRAAGLLLLPARPLLALLPVRLAGAPPTRALRVVVNKNGTRPKQVRKTNKLKAKLKAKHRRAKGGSNPRGKSQLPKGQRKSRKRPLPGRR